MSNITGNARCPFCGELIKPGEKAILVAPVQTDDYKYKLYKGNVPLPENRLRCIFYGGKVEKLLYHIDCYNKNILDGYIE